MSRGPAGRSAKDEIEIVGARVNNLKDLDVKFPLGAVTMLAGVSGSGKSSLLADTLATEANSRMRRFLGAGQDHLEDSEPDAFVGALPASLHFSQGAFRASRRTTVATCSGLLGTLRTFFVRHGLPWSDEAGEAVPAPSASSYAAWLRRHYRGEVAVWAVPMRHVRGDGRQAIAKLRQIGVTSVVVRSETDPPALQETGRTLEIDGFRPLDPDVRHVIEAEVARLRVPSRAPLEQALENAFAVGGGVVVELPDAGAELQELRGPHGLLLDSDRHVVHPEVARPYAPPNAALFSFNQPSSERSGACPDCQGLGEALGVVEDCLVVHPERSLHEGAFALWTEKGYKYVNIQHETIEGLRGVDSFDPDVAWHKLPQRARRRILEGGVDVVDRDLVKGRRLGAPRPFPGFVPAILERFRKGTKTSERLLPFVEEGPCPGCGGSRWSWQARAVRVAGRGLAELLVLPSSELAELCAPRGEWHRSVPAAARSYVDQLHHLASSFTAVGLGHLAGERGMLTLSEGESRRLRLAGLLHARGQGLALLLDEPARGLHEQDVGMLSTALHDLKRRHTIVLNEHRFALAPAVDHVVELGPGAGGDGGRLVRQGPPEKVLEPDGGPPSRTALAVPPRHSSLVVKGARLHNLRDVSCRIPLGRMVAVTGVSGSGKSTFVRGVLLPALVSEFGDGVVFEGFSTLPGGRWQNLSGADGVREVVAVEQRRPETNRRSLVATYLGVAETLRRIYGAASAAREAGLRARDFGLNGGDGRCGACLGLGEVEDGTGFALCPTCGGRRFGERVLAVRLAGFNMAEILERPVADLVSAPPDWAAELTGLFRLLADLDLGYLTLGRRLDRLSGGEVQRLRIAERLWRAPAQGMLLVLDEPAAGLHPRDVVRLLRVLDRIVGEGENTVLLVEHNLHLIRASDWVIDFGPGGGPAGGQILAQGPPVSLSSLDTPTGRALKKRRAGRKRRAAARSAAKEGKISEPSSEQARHARQWLKLLLGHEIRLPMEDSGAGFDGLAVLLSDLETQPPPRPYEIGGLDLELARLFLAASTRPSGVEARPLDPRMGAFAPLALMPAHLCRSHSVGRCSACQGTGHVPALDLDLIVGDPRKAPVAEGFLQPPAVAILKGVRRLVQIPFFRRLEEEGLWSSKKSFSRLSEEERQILLFGYWHRPGAGSFLKSPRADARKVASWLRWDGLFRHLLEQLDRSRDPQWAAGVRESAEDRPCVLCEGSGLGSASRQVSREGRTLHEWVTTGTVEELWQALRVSACETPRERRLRDRVVRGLRAVAKRRPAARLCESLEDPRALRDGLRTMAAEYLVLPILD